MSEFNEEFKQVSSLIREKESILMAVHERPDGDAVGAMLAMFLVLSDVPDKKTVMFSKDPVPENLKFLSSSDLITHDSRNKSIQKNPPDIFFGFDYGDFERLGVSDDWIKDSIIITVDHHPRAKQRGDLLLIDEDASSTCEIIYHFFREEQYPVSPQIATALLTGIFTDTGGFAHINTSVSTLRAAGDLLQYGASIPKVYKHTFGNKSPRAVKVWGHVLRNITNEKESGMAYGIIARHEFKDFAASLDDFEGLVNMIDMPPDVRFSLLLIEHEPGKIRGSLRSEAFKGIDVSRIACALGGGGHKYAAGFERTGETMENVIKLVKEAAILQLTTDNSDVPPLRESESRPKRRD